MTTPANLTFLTGDIFTTTQPAIGHGVNVFGVMGSGIAVLVKNIYPAVFPPYKEACDAKTLKPGDMLPVKVTEDKWVFNLASQRKPGADAKLEWLEQSLRTTFEFSIENGFSGFALPRIGAGVGGLNWEDVKALVARVSAEYPSVSIELWSLPDAN